MSPSSTAQPPAEIDAVALADRSRTAVTVGVAKWSRRSDGDAIARALLRNAKSLPRVSDQLSVAAREEFTGTLATPITAAGVFGPSTEVGRPFPEPPGRQCQGDANGRAAIRSPNGMVVVAR